jgi:TRAP-type C4-dicarboxylate transport system permease small subunit
LDAAVARAEGTVAVVVLLTMVLVASAQALFFNLAERDMAWARGALNAFSWADAFLQKGTLWLAFIGASLATHHDKHIAVDVLPRLASPRVSAAMRAFSSFASGLVAFALAAVFFQACIVADAAVPFEYEALTPNGPRHVCDVPASAPSGVDRPDLLCAARAGLSWLGVGVSSGSGVAQLIAPLMFAVIGVRLLARAVALGLATLHGTTEVEGKTEPSRKSDEDGSER